MSGDVILVYHLYNSALSRVRYTICFFLKAHPLAIHSGLPSQGSLQPDEPQPGVWKMQKPRGVSQKHPSSLPIPQLRKLRLGEGGFACPIKQ